MKALTLKQPWAWACATGIKPIENRSWRPNRYIFGQPVALHAGKEFDDAGLPQFVECATRARCLSRYRRDYEDVRGAVIAVATFGHTHVYPGDGPLLSLKARYWFFGPYGFPLSNIRKLDEPISCKGKLGFWDVPDDVELQIIKALGGGLRVAG